MRQDAQGVICHHEPVSRQLGDWYGRSRIELDPLDIVSNICLCAGDIGTTTFSFASTRRSLALLLVPSTRNARLRRARGCMRGL